MAAGQKVSVRMSAKLFAKLSRLAEQVYQSPETYIEGALSHLVCEISAAQRQMRDPELIEELDESDGGSLVGYL